MTRQEKIAAEVEKHDWLVFKIIDDELPPFAYTVGLYASFNHPEIIISGITVDTAHVILNDLGTGIRTGIIREADVRYDDILEGHNCVFKYVADSKYNEFLGQVMVYYHDQHVPVLQCVYTDKQGRFPWELGYQLAYQELLY